MSSSSGAGKTLTSPTEQQANAPVATTMDAKLMVATGGGNVQQLKDLVNKQEGDSKMMVVVMAKQQATASAEKPHQGNMDPHLLALASSGSSGELQTLLNGEHGQTSGSSGTDDGSLPIRRASDADTEANELILEGDTAEGDTALHVVAACGQGDNFCTRTREAKHLLLLEQKKDNRRGWWRWCLTRDERHALTTYGYGDGDNFLESARIIYGKAKHLLFVQNKNGDTPLHRAARAGKSNMVACLIDLAFTEGEDRTKELLRKENKHKETALHEAVRVGNKDIVDLLMGKDSELASFPEGIGASPMYLAIVLNQGLLQDRLYEKSHGNLSFAGPNGQNVLHAAVLRQRDLTKLLKWNETYLCPQNKDLTTQRDEKGSTPLHFAAAREKPSIICRQVLEANPDALYQPDHAGFFPIHVAASVGAFRNIDMFVKKYPGSAGLCDDKGRTFLHVAVENKEVIVIRNACRNLSLSWIMNMVDNDGNTALHLALEAGSFSMFCSLLGNPQVNLNLLNKKRETPLDIALYKLPKVEFYNIQSIEAQIRLTLMHVGAVMGVCRLDHFKDNITLRENAAFDESEVLKESTGALGIGSVLIATVTFGATFAVPGGYIADDHTNGGTPILARRYAFDAFIVSNALAFVFSTIATVSLMRSGSPLSNLLSRKTNLRIAASFVSTSITCLTAAFALAAYVVLAPVAPSTALYLFLITFLILLYNQLEFISARLLLLKPLRTRKGVIRALAYSALALLLHHLPLIIIFGFPALPNQSPQIEAPAQAPAPAPAPAPLA
ncbi:ankyrin repeat-containing protein At5g02620-like isoform X2 [Miscanthus floridulus]|uniref:ankyrin repeat-containing protein At5g02620-like isoform X2 n=1 Tax=Miscanthus floridulus TaxID=154761 RepID=UPI00345B466D